MLTWFVVAAVGSVLLLVPLWALDRILNAAAERLKDPTKTYTQYIGAVVGVCSGLISSSLDHDPIISVLVGLSLVFLSTGAAAFIKCARY